MASTTTVIQLILNIYNASEGGYECYIKDVEGELTVS
jgi:hypothetical protein